MKNLAQDIIISMDGVFPQQARDSIVKHRHPVVHVNSMSPVFVWPFGDCSAYVSTRPIVSRSDNNFIRPKRLSPVKS
jgi:hypothetical protein